MPGTETPFAKTRYDGIRPRHVICPACSYHFGGVPIRQGTLTCPECGRIVNFELTVPPPRRSRLAFPVITFLAMAGVGIAFATFTILGGLIVLGLGILASLSLVAFRRWCVGEA